MVNILKFHRSTFSDSKGSWFVTFGAVFSLAFRTWVKWTYQPIERCVVDQVVHDVIHGISYSVQLGLTAGEDAVGQIT